MAQIICLGNGCWMSASGCASLSTTPMLSARTNSGRNPIRFESMDSATRVNFCIQLRITIPPNAWAGATAKLCYGSMDIFNAGQSQFSRASYSRVFANVRVWARDWSRRYVKTFRPGGSVPRGSLCSSDKFFVKFKSHQSSYIWKKDKGSDLHSDC